MVRKMWMVAVAALALVLVPAVSQAQFRQGDWELTLSAQANNGPDFDGVSAGAQGSLGYFLADQLEISLRQSLTYTDFGPGSAWNGTTRAALDFHFDRGRLQPFVGANIGYVYGQSVTDTWEAAPEAGVKYFVNSTTFLQFLVEYEFFFNKGSSISGAFSDGQFIYTLGIGFRF